MPILLLSEHVASKGYSISSYHEELRMVELGLWTSRPLIEGLEKEYSTETSLIFHRLLNS